MKVFCRVCLLLGLSVLLLTSCAGQTAQSPTTTQGKATTTVTTMCEDISTQPTVTTAMTIEPTVTTAVTTVPTTQTTVTTKTTTTTQTTKTTKTTVTVPSSQPTVPEPEEDDTIYVLSLGNSYSQDAQAYLSKIASLEGKTFKTVNLYKAGCSLQTHYNGWINNEAIYNYELNGTANADYNSFVTLKAVLESDQFDVITLQQSSWGSMNYSSYQPYLNDLIAVLREKQPNATIYIHQVWAYGDSHASHNDTSGYSMATMFAKTEAAYNTAAAETGLSLIPSGQAVMNAKEELDKGGYSETSIQRDESHLTKTWGRYMLARLWYEMLTGETPDVTMNQVNASVSNDAAMEALVKQAISDAFAEYPADPVKTEAAA